MADYDGLVMHVKYLYTVYDQLVGELYTNHTLIALFCAAPRFHKEAEDCFAK